MVRRIGAAIARRPLPSAFGWRWWFGALMLMLAPGMAVSIPDRGSGASSTAAAPAFTLYVSEDESGRRLRELDPASLADRADGVPVAFDAEFPSWLLSSDGSTFVQAKYSDAPADVIEDVIVVRDGITGAERRRFPRPADAHLAHLIPVQDEGLA